MFFNFMGIWGRFTHCKIDLDMIDAFQTVLRLVSKRHACTYWLNAIKGYAKQIARAPTQADLNDRLFS